MFRRSMLGNAAWVALGGTLSLSAAPLMAQQTLDRVEITGSAIKRINQEGALPIQTLTREDIAKSGATSVEGLIQALPSMQGFYTSSESVNGNGGGVQNASIHNIGNSSTNGPAGYTLVLLNGRRLASYTAGSAVNLSSIPLAAVERVEILTDGASTLYGSDAIAGVINFVLRRNQQDFSIEASTNRPQRAGGSSSQFAISKGIGSLDDDGYNVLFAFSHDEQKALAAKQRKFTKSGIQGFSEGGKDYSLYQLALNTAPASVTLNFKNTSVDPVTFSPNYLKDGVCAPNTAYIGTATDQSCWFDYSATVQLIPESKRDSLFASTNIKLTPGLNLFAEGVYSKFDLRGQYAPPAQALSLALTDTKYTTYVTPYLARLGINPADVAKATMNIRFADAGGRAEDFKTVAKHVAVGLEGTGASFDYSTSYTHSESERRSYFVGGFMSRDRYNAILATGAFDPFGPVGSSAAILAPALLNELDQQYKTTLDILSARASKELFKAPGGPVQLGVGADLTRQKYEANPSSIRQGPNSLQPNWTDTPLGAAPGALPVDASRRNWGTFAELLVPVAKGAEITGALRYDDYTAVTNSKNFDVAGNLVAPAKQGNPANKLTYKLSGMLRPNEATLVRASYGTGFKVADMDQVTQPIQDGGVTSGKYNCPVAAPDPRAADCKGNTQYDLLQGGNPLTGDNGLKPEQSKQVNFGLRFEPVDGVSLGWDVWDVKMRDQIIALPESFPFDNPGAYQALFSTVFDAGIGANKLATLLPYFNIGKSRYTGIDWDNSIRGATAWGPLALRWTGTYMIRSEVSIPGSPTESNVGRFDAYNNATSRIIMHISASLSTSNLLTHTFGLNYRSGYKDQTQTPDDAVIKEVNPDGSLGDFVGIERRVSSNTTLDWQTQIKFQKSFTVTVGIKNILDKGPSFSVRTAGGGNQVGYDGRYNSPLGRQFYLAGSAKF